MDNPFCFSFATIDSNANILNQSDDFRTIFKVDDMLYNSPLLQDYKHVLKSADDKVIKNCESSKLLLINIADKNYILTKSPYIVQNHTFGIYLLLEEFRINALRDIISFSSYISQNINPKFTLIENYSSLQKEVIFCLLTGLHSDKTIAQFIEAKTGRITSTHAIKNALKEIYNKLLANDRESLTRLCYQLEFDRYIPKTFLAPGIYNSSEINSIIH